MDAITELVLDYMDTRPELLMSAARVAQYGHGDADANVREALKVNLAGQARLRSLHGPTIVAMLLERVDWPAVTRRCMYHKFDEDTLAPPATVMQAQAVIRDMEH